MACDPLFIRHIRVARFPLGRAHRGQGGRRPTSPPPHRWICAHGRRRSPSLSPWHLLCLGDLCTPTSDAPGDQRCNIRSSRRAVRASNSPSISRPKLAGANFSAFAVGTVVQDQMSCALSPMVQSLRPSPVLPFVLEPLRVTRCQSSCANAADQPAMLLKLDVSACVQPLGPSSAVRITPQNMRFTILGGGGAKLAALCLITALCIRIFPCSSSSAVTATKSLISSSVCWFCGAL